MRPHCNAERGCASGEMVSVERRRADEVIELVLKPIPGILQHNVHPSVVIVHILDEHLAKITADIDPQPDDLVEHLIHCPTRHVA